MTNTHGTLQEYTIQGRRAKLHPACVEGFREDRRHGLIYGPYWLPTENRFAQSAEEASVLLDMCPYCGER